MSVASDHALTTEVIRRATQLGITLGTVESCTGGLVAAELTSVPGASEVYLGGYVTYTNEAKHTLVGVVSKTLETHGAVSEKTAIEMASGCKTHLNCDIAISVTGVAGPGGGSDKTPVGTVWFGLSDGDKTTAVLRHFGALTRDEIRSAAVRQSIELISDALCAK